MKEIQITSQSTYYLVFKKGIAHFLKSSEGDRGANFLELINIYDNDVIKTTSCIDLVHN